MFKDKERRLHSRYSTLTRVRVDKSKLCNMINVSSSGCCIVTKDLQLVKGDRVRLAFIFKGNVIKVHIRQATVCHTTKGTTGFQFQKLQEIYLKS